MDYETERDDVVKDREYMLLGKSTWIDVKNLTVNVQRSETGITVDVWPRELMRGYAPIATLSVPFSEGSDDED